MGRRPRRCGGEGSTAGAPRAGRRGIRPSVTTTAASGRAAAGAVEGGVVTTVVRGHLWESPFRGAGFHRPGAGGRLEPAPRQSESRKAWSSLSVVPGSCRCGRCPDAVKSTRVQSASSAASGSASAGTIIPPTFGSPRPGGPGRGRGRGAASSKPPGQPPSIAGFRSPGRGRRRSGRRTVSRPRRRCWRRGSFAGPRGPGHSEGAIWRRVRRRQFFGQAANPGPGADRACRRYSRNPAPAGRASRSRTFPVRGRRPTATSPRASADDHGYRSSCTIAATHGGSR